MTIKQLQNNYNKRMKKRKKHGKAVQVIFCRPVSVVAYIFRPRRNRPLCGMKIFNSNQSLKLGRE